MSKKNSVGKLQQVKGWISALSMRTKIIIMIGVLFLIIVVVLLYLVKATDRSSTSLTELDNHGLTAAQIARRDADVLQAQREGAIRDRAQEAIDKGDFDQASSVYKTAINAESDTIRKVQLYIDQSLLLYNVGKYNDAIAVAREAESIGTDQFLVGDWLSRLYEDQRQYAKAAEYYNLAAKWAGSVTNRTGLSEAHYKSQAERVSALVGK